MALGWFVCCSSETDFALQRSCKDSEWSKRYSYSLFIFFTSKFSVDYVRAPAHWTGPQRQIFWCCCWVAWRLAWKSEEALCKDFHLHGFGCCWCPSAWRCWSLHFLWNPFLLLLTKLQLTAAVQMQGAEDWMQRELTKFKMWLIGEDNLSRHKAQSISF